MASAYQAIANGGVRLNPILVAGCKDQDGELTSIPKSTATQVVSTQTARDLVLMLEKVVEDGAIGKATAVPGYRSAGKTGTAEIPEGSGYGDFFATSFFGMAPTEDPQYAMGVVVYKPRAVYTNSMSAAVGYQKILSQILLSNRVPPSTTTSFEIPSNW
jgi:cell division protein FtsI (penicillin-binding protein 3)